MQYNKNISTTHSTSRNKRKGGRKKMQFIALTNGSFVLNDYDTYGSGLTFITTHPILEWENLKKGERKLPNKKYMYIYGNYWVSKRGTKCFSPNKKDSKHILIYQKWHNNSKQSLILLPDSTKDNSNIYWENKVVSSISSGRVYAIYPKDWVYKLEIEKCKKGEENV